MSHQPIKPSVGGKIVDLAEFRLQRGVTRRERSNCQHSDLVFCEKERRVWCQDCESEVENFDAFVALAKNLAHLHADIDRRERLVKEMEQVDIKSRAAKAFDKIFRKKNSVPGCPHCKKPIFPEDVLGPRGVLEISRKIAEQLRK